MKKIKYNRLALLFILVFMSFSPCKAQSISIDGEKAKILKLHNSQRENHFDKDSIAFANQHSENFILINNGKISTPNKSEMISVYNRYFSLVEFLKWDDVSEPVVRFSDDMSLAYTVVDKIVVLTYKNTNGDTVEQKKQYAWTAIYKKYGDDWKIDCLTSTERPVSEQ